MIPDCIFDIYTAICELVATFGIFLQGQVQFIAPLINAMAQASGKVNGELTELELDQIKGRTAASENLGNFFALNLFFSSSTVVATLGMTAGYCGTIMTQMAANFNSCQLL